MLEQLSESFLGQNLHDVYWLYRVRSKKGRGVTVVGLWENDPVLSNSW